MARKDYPFNKRDLNYGINLTTKILTSSLYLLKDMPKGSNVSSDIYPITNEKYKKLKPLRLKFTHFICGFFFLLAPLLFLFLISVDCWVFFAFIITIVYKFIFAIPINDLLSEEYIFNRIDLNKQVKAVKIILKLWAIIFCIHSVFYLGYNILQWWLIVDNSFTSNFYYTIRNILWRIGEVQSITTILAFFVLSFNIISFVYFIKILKNINKKLCENKSIANIIKSSKYVNSNILYDLFDRKDKNSQLTFEDGCIIRNIMSDDIMKRGFILIDNSGKVFSFYVEDYVKTHTELLKKGNTIFKSISDDINERLKQFEVEYMINN